MKSSKHLSGRRVRALRRESRTHLDTVNLPFFSLMFSHGEELDLPHFAGASRTRLVHWHQMTAKTNNAHKNNVRRNRYRSISSRAVSTERSSAETKSNLRCSSMIASRNMGHLRRALGEALNAAIPRLTTATCPRPEICPQSDDEKKNGFDNSPPNRLPSCGSPAPWTEDDFASSCSVELPRPQKIRLTLRDDFDTETCTHLNKTGESKRITRSRQSLPDNGRQILCNARVQRLARLRTPFAVRCNCVVVQTGTQRQVLWLLDGPNKRQKPQIKQRPRQLRQIEVRRVQTTKAFSPASPMSRLTTLHLLEQSNRALPKMS